MRRRALPGSVRRSAVAAVAVMVLSAVTACSAGPAAPSPSTPEPLTGDPAATSTATPTTPPAPTLVPDGTAAENLPYFTQIVAGVWATPDNVAGRAYIDALTAAGFDKTRMQLTPDETTVGQPAESIEFSVAWRDACLVGQVGPSTGDPVAAVVPLLAGGTCLIGATRPIDW